MSSFDDLCSDLVGLIAACLDVSSFGSLANTSKQTHACSSNQNLVAGVLVRHVHAKRKRRSRSDTRRTYEALDLGLLIEGPGSTGSVDPKIAKSPAGCIKLRALKSCIRTAQVEQWEELDEVVRESFENAMMLDNIVALRYLLSIKKPADSGVENGCYLKSADMESALTHAVDAGKAELAWTILKSESAPLLVTSETLRVASIRAATYGDAELTGCFLAYLCKSNMGRLDKNAVIARCSVSAASENHPKLAVNLTTMLQFRSKLWQFRLAEERAERMRKEQERLRELEEEARSRFFSRRRRDQRSPEVIAREQAEIEKRAMREEKQAIFGVKDFKQALSDALEAAVRGKHLPVLEAYFKSHLHNQVSKRLRRSLFKMAVRSNDPDNNDNYVDVAKYFLREKLVKHEDARELLMDSIRRNAVYSVMTLLEINEDKNARFLTRSKISGLASSARGAQMTNLLSSY